MPAAVVPNCRRATVRLVLACNNACVFCAQEGLAMDASRALGAATAEAGARAVARALEGARAESDAVTFLGGEPTLHEGLVAHVAAARALGFTRVGLQTNGARLADASYAKALVQAGLTDIHLSIHGAGAAEHDYHSGRPGSFALAVSALRIARQLDLAVAVTTLLTRSNFRVIARLPPLLAAAGVVGWLVSIPVVAGRAALAFDRVVPRLGLALPFALHALSVAQALKLPAWVTGAPLCLLGPFVLQARPREPPGEAGSYAGACESCPVKPECPGVDPAYLARFAGDELHPRERASESNPAPTESGRAVAAMFVGVGDVAQRKASLPPSNRVSLPLFGKVNRAAAEARPNAERRTGGALKEILPALFESAAVETPSGDTRPKP